MYAIGPNFNGTPRLGLIVVHSAVGVGLASELEGELASFVRFGSSNSHTTRNLGLCWLTGLGRLGRLSFCEQERIGVEERLWLASRTVAQKDRNTLKPN